MSNGDPESKAPRRSTSGFLLAAPTEIATTSAEEVLMSEHRAQIKRNQVEELKADREIEKERDWHRQRAVQEAQQAAEERRREAEANDARQEREWRNNLLEMAMDHIPHDAPPETRLRVIKRIEETLDQLDPTRSERVVRCELDAALEGGLKDWLQGEQAKRASERRRQRVDRAIEVAIGRLPRVQGLDMSKVEHAARRAVSGAIAELPEDATDVEMEQAADLALAEARGLLEHIARCRRCADSSWLDLRDLSWEERDRACADVRAALLSNLKPGCSEAEMQKVREREIARIQAERLKRRAQEKAEKAAKEKTEAKQRLVEYSLSELHFYVTDLIASGKSEKPPSMRELKGAIREDLEQELDGSESIEDVKKLMREMVREALGIHYDRTRRGRW
jgi:hypothetical protein